MEECQNVDLNIVKEESEFENVKVKCEPRLEDENNEAQNDFNFFEDNIEIKEEPLIECMEYEDTSVRSSVIGGEESEQALIGCEEESEQVLIGCGGFVNVSLQLPTEHIKLESASQADCCSSDEMETLSRLPAWQRESLICQPASQDSRDPLSLEEPCGGQQEVIKDPLSLEGYTEPCGDDTSSMLQWPTYTPSVVNIDHQRPSTSVNKKTVDEILASHPNVDSNVCPLCQKVFEYKSKVKLHIASCHLKNHKRKKVITTVIQGHSLKDILDLKEGKYKCQICLKSFYDHVKFQEHVEICESYTYQLCPLCQKTLGRSESIKQHITLIHLYKAPYECCDQTFSEKSAFEMHIENTHHISLSKNLLQRFEVVDKILEKNKAVNICPLCNNIFFDKKGLRYHIYKIHLTFQCLGCSKSFADNLAISKFEKNFNVESLKNHKKLNLCNFCQIKPTRDVETILSMSDDTNPEEALLNTIMASRVEDGHNLCPLCHAVLRNRHYIKSHIHKVHVKSYILNKGDEKINNILEKIMSKNNIVLKKFTPKNANDVVEKIVNKQGKVIKYKCKLCFRTYLDHITICNHISKTHLQKSNYECENCKRLFSEENYYVDHVKTCEKSQTCPLCQRKVESKIEIKDHITMVHLEKRPYYCFSCNQNFSDSDSFKIHIEIIHNIAEVASERVKVINKTLASQFKNTCPLCQKILGDKNSLRTHIYTQHLSFKCRKCTKLFFNMWALSKHQNVAQNNYIEKPRFCEECGESSIPVLRKKNFQCANCENTFVTKNDMRRHALSNYCSEIQTKDVDNLLSKYKNLDPKMCPICKKIFTRQVLKLHISRIHLNKTYTCQICSKSFCKEINLEKHSRYSHTVYYNFDELAKNGRELGNSS